MLDQTTCLTKRTAPCNRDICCVVYCRLKKNDHTKSKKGDCLLQGQHTTNGSVEVLIHYMSRHVCNTPHDIRRTILPMAMNLVTSFQVENITLSDGPRVIKA